MACQELYFVQVFDITPKNKLVPGPSFQVSSADEARAKAERLSQNRIGVVAFAQQIDKDTGDADEPYLLAHYGRIPPEAQAMAA